MQYELCKFGDNRAKDMSMWGIYITKFGQISVKFALMGLKFGTDHAKVHLHRYNISPLLGEKNSKITL